jgi:putative pyruvate formate lyase activating enzyme
MMSIGYPGYVGLWESGELRRRAETALARLEDCAVCARECRVDRLGEDRPPSFCGTARHAVVSSCFPHHGEEDCLRGWGGSGTIFFSHCNLRCVFCQNYEISWLGEGRETGCEELAGMMLALERRGCHNINFVTPSHVVPQILEALVPAVERGLRLPLVYNTGGYDGLETLKLLDGVVDVYMPDFKFWAPEVSKRLAHAEDYREVASRAIREMHRQVGDLEIDRRGIARRGLLVRHLVMPDDLAGTREVMRFLAEEISIDTYVNVMGQYRPQGRAAEHEKIDRPVTRQEVGQAVATAREMGLHRFSQW